jgi:crotonobetainyl-CoA:carnitine CoA-transferase CaiB-like acyl-CoA transferase
VNNSLPLSGVRVVEFAHMVMGPTCGLILADLGAEVIKIEPRVGEHTRDILSSIGYDPRTIGDLVARKVVAAAD